MAASDIYNGVFSTADEPIPNEFPDMLSAGIKLQSSGFGLDTYSAVHRAKYHMYEVNGYWPVIYRIILNGSADPELLPYGPLFFESVTAFLSDANMALWICRPKAWFLCARFVLTCRFPFFFQSCSPCWQYIHYIDGRIESYGCPTSTIARA
jgi:hypothetical protein